VEGKHKSGLPTGPKSDLPRGVSDSGVPAVAANTSEGQVLQRQTSAVSQPSPSEEETRGDTMGAAMSCPAIIGNIAISNPTTPSGNSADTPSGKSGITSTGIASENSGTSLISPAAALKTPATSSDNVVGLQPNRSIGGAAGGGGGNSTNRNPNTKIQQDKPATSQSRPQQSREEQKSQQQQSQRNQQSQGNHQQQQQSPSQRSTSSFPNPDLPGWIFMEPTTGSFFVTVGGPGYYEVGGSSYDINHVDGVGAATVPEYDSDGKTTVRDSEDDSDGIQIANEQDTRDANDANADAGAATSGTIDDITIDELCRAKGDQNERNGRKSGNFNSEKEEALSEKESSKKKSSSRETKAKKKSNKKLSSLPSSPVFAGLRVHWADSKFCGRSPTKPLKTLTEIEHHEAQMARSFAHFKQVMEKVFSR
jgi:hypothetical protein